MSRKPEKPPNEPLPYLQNADASINAIYRTMITHRDVKQRRKARKLLRRLGFSAQIENIDIIPQRPALYETRVRRVRSEKEKARGRAFLEKKAAERRGDPAESTQDTPNTKQRRLAASAPSVRPQSHQEPSTSRSAAKLPPLPPDQRYVFQFLSSGITCEGKARSGVPVNARSAGGGRYYDDFGRQVVVVDVPICPPRREWEAPFRFDEDTGTWIQAQSDVPVKVQPPASEPRYSYYDPYQSASRMAELTNPLRPTKPTKPLGACPDQPRNAKCPPGCGSCTGYCGR